jgi:hypothetical protein
LSALDEFGFARNASQVQVKLTPSITLRGKTSDVLASLFKSAKATASDPSFGDFDASGARDANDLAKLQDIVFGSSVERGQRRRYDLNCDGVVDEYDLSFWVLLSTQ